MEIRGLKARLILVKILRKTVIMQKNDYFFPTGKGYISVIRPFGNLFSRKSPLLRATVNNPLAATGRFNHPGFLKTVKQMRYQNELKSLPGAPWQIIIIAIPSSLKNYEVLQRLFLRTSVTVTLPHQFQGS
ncbi:hypothetical protein NQ317_011279 [Molorchus minor]|uniref:Uncharacterized protein n=1 Tax=Molorchus minor TaxID=1323400 RepID=A0ABQ9IWF2_9CUCU|nr:hypothetical protein NQ317_011279 [Molorchus minor]